MLGPAIRLRGRAAAGYDFTGDAMPAGATLARGSAASVLRNGRIAPVAGDAPRLTGAGLLLEPAATNLIARSGTMASWGADSGGVDAAPPAIALGAATAPDGGAADRVTLVRGAGFARLMTTIPEVAAGPYVLSLWMRSDADATGPSLRVDGYDGAPAAIGAGWRRVTLAFASAGGAVPCQVLAWSAIAGSPERCTVDLWGAQLERGTAATSTVTTGAGTATRAAERLTLDWARHGIGDGARGFALHLADGAIERRVLAVAGGATTLGPLGPVPLARVLPE